MRRISPRRWWRTRPWRPTPPFCGSAGARGSPRPSRRNNPPSPDLVLAILVPWPGALAWRSVAPVGVAAGAVQRHPIMLGERADRVALIGVGIGVSRSDDDRPKAPVIATARRQHCGRQRVAVAVAQREE